MTNQDLYKRFGNPMEVHDFMVMFDVPTELEIGVLPKKVYCNKIFVEPFTKGLINLKERGLATKITTWDGCYNPRPIRGYEKKYLDLIKSGRISDAVNYLSKHSWGTAFDIDAAFNPLGKTPQIKPDVVKCFTDVGFIWGGRFQRKDGMHFEL